MAINERSMTASEARPLSGAAGAVGALYQGNGICTFRVWSPLVKEMSVRMLSRDPVLVSLERDELGYWTRTLRDVRPGTRYLYRLNDDKERPDPASRSQPDGVHGPSAVVDPVFSWQDEDWKGIPLRDLIIYELHIGTFTPEGTFEAAVARLDDLLELGITAIEIMPVAQFPAPGTGDTTACIHMLRRAAMAVHQD